ncbi:unnamed protein product [Cylindrotheca closterium]|uniref:Uncharacterized protein n=1 Tax=Cylindrotheca closterium TaxID=2856 RepID=A0AAD2D0H8_9STRA|nr:unnamed protein product [Cylindrotheca closterium]
MKLTKSIRVAAPIVQALTTTTTTTSAIALSASNNMTSGSPSRAHVSSASSAQQQQCKISTKIATTALDKARALELPSREETLRRDQKVYDFWNHNDELLEDAWKEWQATQDLPKLDESLIHPKLRQVVDDIWQIVQESSSNDFDDNTVAAQELVLKELFDEVAPGTSV